MLIELLSNTVVKAYKRFQILGAWRFRILWFAHRLFLPFTGLHKQWEFILGYLPSLSKKSRGKLRILEVGCTPSLLIYELDKRGYETHGVDLRPYQERLPPRIKFYQGELSKINLPEKYFSYVVAMSVIQHAGMGQYGEIKNKDGDKIMIREIARVLEEKGQLLLTTPNEKICRYISYPLKGYNYFSLKELVHEFFEIQEYAERHGNICVALIKK